ncbi:MAG: hypothetical protein HY975_01890 [Candidatus Kerfeldbacteria bacterium]|nr:hypothetical protein [Candidatus Kerfeldbacteria bacterium]
MSVEQEGRQPDKLRELESIETPVELLAYMKDNVQYGFVRRSTKEVIANNTAETSTAFAKEYYLQSPEELLESHHGVCWDSTELERRWFDDHGYHPQVFFLMYAKEGGTDLPTHTFVAFEKDQKWYWFEHAFADQRGIHEYASLNELLDDVKLKHHQYAVKNRGAADEDFSRLRSAPFEQPKYGVSAQEFVEAVLKQNKSLVE